MVENFEPKRNDDATLGIEIDKGLFGYLERDDEVIVESRNDWEPELWALGRLADIFRRLISLIVINDKNLNVPAQLLLVAINQLYGVASELLRRRTRDAQAMTRRAIEAAGIAYRLWKDPSLTDVFYQAYPHINDAQHPDRFTPSKRIEQNFGLVIFSLQLTVPFGKRLNCCMTFSAPERRMLAWVP